MTRLLCSGDWHIGAGSEYGRRPGDRLRDQADVCQRIAALAAERDADGILLAGDLLNGPTLAPEHLAVLADFAAAAPCPILAITGNGTHDLAMRAVNGLAILDRIPGIIVSSRPDVYEFAGCAVATLPWVSPALLVAQIGGGDRDEIHADVARLLVDVAEAGKEDCDRIVPGGPHILLGHWSVSGASLPTGLPVDQLREPVIPFTDLDAIGFDHIVLGHIHKAQQVGAHGFYVGSPMPLSFGEAAGRDSHGVWILHTDERDVIDAYAAEFVPIDSRPFVTVDYTDYTENAVSLVGVEDAIVRVRYTATANEARDIDHAAIRRDLLDAGAAVVKIVPEIIRQDRARVAGLDEQVSELDALEQWMVADGISGDLVDAMRAKTAEYLMAAIA